MLGVRAVGAMIVASAGLLIIGAMLGDHFRTPDEASLRHPPPLVPVTDPVQEEILERTLTIRGQLEPAQRGAPRFSPGVEGMVVTRVRVRSGSQLKDGQVALEVEGRPIIVLTGSFPAWRAFSLSMSPGPDVRQLQQALKGLHLYKGKVDGRFGRSTLKAVIRLYRSVGTRPPSRSTINHDELMFVPVHLRTIEHVDVVVGDLLRQEAITLTSEVQRIEADITPDQRATIAAGARIRVLASSSEGAWTGVIDRVDEIPAVDGSALGRVAITTRPTPPESLVDEQAFEILIASTGRRVLSASPASIHMTGAGDPFVVVLIDGQERTIPVAVGLATSSRVEIRPRVDNSPLGPGSELILATR